MSRHPREAVLSLLAAVLLAPGAAIADLPYPPFSTCAIVITQSPSRTQCIDNFEPDVVRLCPSTGSPQFDRVRFDATIRDWTGIPVTGAVLTAYETAGIVNIAAGGSTTDTTDAEGRGSIEVVAAGGYGRIALCASGVFIREIQVRSPDVAQTTLPSGCRLPTQGTSWVSASDKTNPSCGFTANFGAVTTGVNDSWDLNCDGVVNASDAQGMLGKGGFLQHYGHGGILGARSACP